MKQAISSRLQRHLSEAGLRCLAAVAVVLLLLSPGLAHAQHPDPSAEASTTNLSLYTGIARPCREVRLAMPSDGLLLRVLAEEGDKVEIGQTLATMDDRTQKAMVKIQELIAADGTEVTEAEARVRFLELEMRQLTRLRETQTASQIEVESKQLELDEARAVLEGARLDLAQAAERLEAERRRLESLHIDAPFGGTILERMVESGSALNLGEGIFRVADLSRLEAKIALPAEMWKTLQVGKVYRLKAGSPVSSDLPAVMLRVRPEVDSASRTMLVTFEIDNSRGELPAGFRVELSPEEPLKDSFVEADADDEPT